MMDKIRRCADISIRRGLGFAALAVACTMAGLAYDPASALRAAAMLCALITAVLAWKAWVAPQKPYKRTELWILLDRRHDLPENRAQAVIGRLLRGRYLRHAEVTGAIAIGFELLGFALSFLLPAGGAA